MRSRMRLVSVVTVLISILTASVVDARPRVGRVSTLEAAYARWESARVGRGDIGRLAVPIGYAKGLSAEYTETRGWVAIDLGEGAVDVYLRDLPGNGTYGVWLVDNLPGPGASARPQEFDRRLFVGALTRTARGEGVLTAALPAGADAGFEIDRIVVTPAGALPEHGLLYASPSVFQRLFYRERLGEIRRAGLVAAPGRWAPGLSRRELFERMIEEGEDLFFNETFSGNGRTCGTCHPTANNFTIDQTFIARLPDDDPLFVAENDILLTQLENPVLMRDFGLILENIDGFEDPTNKFVMRSVPHLLGLALTIDTGAGLPPLQGTGWSGDGAPDSGTLRDFAVGAVTQHFPQTLDRIDGDDFRLPTETELDDLEAFQLSLGRDRELEITTMTLLDSQAEAGRVAFTTTDSDFGRVEAGKCIVCHNQAGSMNLDSGLNENRNTNVESRDHPADATGELRPIDGGFGKVLNPIDGGFGDGTFNPPSLVEAADTGPFFHNNVVNDLFQAVSFYGEEDFQESPAAIELQNLDTGGAPIDFDQEQMLAFLAVLNILENTRSVIAYAESAELEPVFVDAVEIIDFAIADLIDAGQVMTTVGLHPEALPFLIFSFQALQRARTTIDQGQRNVFLEASAMALKGAQPLLVVPRVVFTSHEDGDSVSGTVVLEGEVLDVGTRGMGFFIDDDLTCLVFEEPFVCTWDTTLETNGAKTIRATTLDFQDDFTSGEITLFVGN